MKRLLTGVEPRVKTARMAVAVAVSLGVIVLAPATALACSCVGMNDTETLAQSDVAFAGYVVEGAYPAEVKNANDTLGEVVWTFIPETLVKGVDAGKVEVRSESQGSACGVNFLIDQRYLVFADEEDGNLFTSSCHRTRAYSTDVKLLGAKKVPGFFGQTQAGAEEIAWKVIVPVGSALLVGAMALFLLRRRRRVDMGSDYRAGPPRIP